MRDFLYRDIMEEDATVVFVRDRSGDSTCGPVSRNILLHSKTSNGKAEGEPIAAVLNEGQLKSLKALKSALTKIIKELQQQDVEIENIYYVCKGKRSLPVVSIFNETGIKQALEEYPEIQRNGHRSTALLKLACDWHLRGDAVVASKDSPRGSFPTSPSTPQVNKVPSHRIRIEVHAGVNLNKNSADGPIHTIHNVNSKENLASIKKLIRDKVPTACFRAGFYWLQPKQTKPLHTLVSDHDLETAKDAYRDDITGMVKGLRLATVIQSDGERTQSAKRSLTSSISNQVSRKRSHEDAENDNDDDDNDDDDAREFDAESFKWFQKASSGKPALKDNNSSWNKIHIELRKALEETGNLSRFGMKHLSLWTDLIQKGDVAGVREEPDWSKYRHIVEVEPVSRAASRLVTSKGQASTVQGSGVSDLLTTMLIQQQMRREEERAEKLEYERKLESERKKDNTSQQNMIQALLLQALSSRSPSSDGHSNTSCTTTVLANKGLMAKTSNEVCDILTSLNLGQYAPCFMENGIDGSTLSFITEDGLKELGILSPIHRSKILGYVAREK